MYSTPPSAGRHQDLVFDAWPNARLVIPDKSQCRARQAAGRSGRDRQLIAKGTPVARSNTGIDGGMNRVFASKLPDGSTGLSEGGDGQGLSLVALSRAPGPSLARQSAARACYLPEEPLAASMAPAQAPAPATRVASAVPNAQSDGFFSNLARKVGLGGADTTATAQPIPQNRKSSRPSGTTAASGDACSQSRSKASTPAASETKQIAAARPPLKPSPPIPRGGRARPKDSQVAGSQPILPANRSTTASRHSSRQQTTNRRVGKATCPP